jgi:hypothetical protein
LQWTPIGVADDVAVRHRFAGFLLYEGHPRILPDYGMFCKHPEAGFMDFGVFEGLIVILTAIGQLRAPG